MITILIRKKREVGGGGEGEKRERKKWENGVETKKNREKLVFTLIKALLNYKIRFVTGVPPSISEWFLKKSFRLIVFLLYSDQILLSC